MFAAWSKWWSRTGAALAMAGACVAGAVQAADFPTRPLKIVLAYETGGSIDFVGRKVAEGLSARLGQPVLVEAKPGANERIASSYLLSQPADGYTMLLIAVPHSTNVTLFNNLPYDTRKDFQPLIWLTDVTQLVVVRGDSPYKTFGDLVNAAKAKPGQITYAAPGIATGTHLMMAMLTQLAGVDMMFVPYKGVAPMSTAILGGHTDVGVFSVSSQLVGMVESGRMRALGIPSKKRWSVLPNVPTLAEQGYPDAIGATWFGLLMKAGTPPEIVQRLNKEINAILATPEVKASIQKAGMDPVGGTPEQFGAHIRNETDRWGKVIRERNIRLE